jgi:hypothetical protein
MMAGAFCFFPRSQTWMASTLSAARDAADPEHQRQRIAFMITSEI